MQPLSSLVNSYHIGDYYEYIIMHILYELLLCLYQQLPTVKILVVLDHFIT